MKVKIDKKELPKEGRSSLNKAVKNVKEILEVSKSRVIITFNEIESVFELFLTAMIISHRQKAKKQNSR